MRPMRYPRLSFRQVAAAFALFLRTFATEDPILGDDLKLNQIQVIGTHNSYHLAPTPAMMRLIETANREAAPGDTSPTC